MSVELGFAERRFKFHNPSVKVGDTVYAQDLADDELGLPPETYHTRIYEVGGTRPGDKRIDVILRDGTLERVVDLCELMEHGIDGGERLTVVPVDTEECKDGRAMDEILRENPHAWLE